VLLRLRNQRAVVDDRAIGNDRGPVSNRDAGRDEGARRVSMSGADFGELARASAHRILVALRAGSRVEHRAESGLRVVRLLEQRLIPSVRIAWRLRDTIALAL